MTRRWLLLQVLRNVRCVGEEVGLPFSGGKPDAHASCDVVAAAPLTLDGTASNQRQG